MEKKKAQKQNDDFKPQSSIKNKKNLNYIRKKRNQKSFKKTKRITDNRKLEIP